MIRLKSILLEQTLSSIDTRVFTPNRKAIVKRAYEIIVNAVAGWGTNTDKITSAIRLFNDPDDFRYLLTLFKDKRTGYNSFETMINQEYDRFNLDDIIQLRTTLRDIGVSVTWKQSTNYIGTNKFFDGGFKITSIGKNRLMTYTEYKSKLINYNKQQSTINLNCKSKWQSELPRAVKFWTDWLGDPITQRRVFKNWSLQSDKNTVYNMNSFLKTWERYLDTLSNLKLIFYNNSINHLTNNLGVDIPTSWANNAYAFVLPRDFNNIYINCSMNDPDTYGTLIHEIQHIIYNIKPLNSEFNIGNVFVNQTTKKHKPTDILKSIGNLSVTKTPETAPVDDTIIRIAKQISVAPDMLVKWKKALINMQARDPSKSGYICKPTEKMSNIMAIRKTLNVQPGGKITLTMLKPYIEFKKHHTDIVWLLLCWTKNNFPDINQMLNKINQLAINKTKSADDSNNNLA